MNWLAIVDSISLILFPVCFHYINFVVTKSYGPYYFYSSIVVGKNIQSATFISDQIISKIEAVGSSKISSLILDSAPNMKCAMKIIKSKYPKLIMVNCAAHAAHHLMEDVLTMDKHKLVTEESKKVIQFF